MLYRIPVLGFFFCCLLNSSCIHAAPCLIGEMLIGALREKKQQQLIIFSANIRIDKAPPQDLPRFTRHPQGLILNDGDEAVIECTVAGSDFLYIYIRGVFLNECKLFIT